MGLNMRELIIGRIFASEIWGGGAYFREGLSFGEGGGAAYYLNLRYLAYTD